MPDLTLRTESQPEESIAGWFVADGHWHTEIGVLLIISPAMRDRIKSEGGLNFSDLGRALARTEHCMQVVLQRQRDAVTAKARDQ